MRRINSYRDDLVTIPSAEEERAPRVDEEESGISIGGSQICDEG